MVFFSFFFVSGAKKKVVQELQKSFQDLVSNFIETLGLKDELGFNRV